MSQRQELTRILLYIFCQRSGQTGNAVQHSTVHKASVRLLTQTRPAGVKFLPQRQTELSVPRSLRSSTIKNTVQSESESFKKKTALQYSTPDSSFSSVCGDRLVDHILPAMSCDSQGLSDWLRGKVGFELLSRGRARGTAVAPWKLHKLSIGTCKYCEYALVSNFLLPHNALKILLITRLYQSRLAFIV